MTAENMFSALFTLRCKIDTHEYPTQVNAINVFYREHGHYALATFKSIFIKRRDATSSHERYSIYYTGDNKDIDAMRASIEHDFNTLRVMASIYRIHDDHIALIVEPERVKFFLEKVHPLTEVMPDTIPSANKAQREFWARFLPKDE